MKTKNRWIEVECMFTIDAVGSGLCAAQLQVNADEKAR